MALLSRSEIEAIGFKSVGEDVFISNRASFYNAANISIGNHVRIDDFCVLSAGEGGIAIGNFIHIAVYSSLIGKGKIILGDFCNISSRVSIYSSSDDYSGLTMTNPMVPDSYKQVYHADVHLGRHVIVGCGSTLLPGCELEDGVAIGAMSLVNQNCLAFTLWAGIPARFIRNRERKLLELENAFLASQRR